MLETVIETERLLLLSMTPAFLEAGLAGDVAASERELGFAVAPAWFEEQWLMRLRLDDLRENPDAGPWLLRAVCELGEQTMIGHIGFHAPPGAPHLEQTAPGGVEVGYTIFPPYRRRGYAAEAFAGMIRWAAAQGVSKFVLSISPDNSASIAIARRFDFRKVGSHIDEIDGPEDVWLLDEAAVRQAQ